METSSACHRSEGGGLHAGDLEHLLSTLPSGSHRQCQVGVWLVCGWCVVGVVSVWLVWLVWLVGLVGLVWLVCGWCG